MNPTKVFLEKNCHKVLVFQGEKRDEFTRFRV